MNNKQKKIAAPDPREEKNLDIKPQPSATDRLRKRIQQIGSSGRKTIEHKHSKLSILHQNIQSIKNKIYENVILQTLLYDSNISPDIICICEHWLQHENIVVQNYHVVACYNRVMLKHGGVLILVRNGLLYKQIETTIKPIEKHFEFSVIANEFYIVLSLYRAPDEDKAIFINNLFSLLQILVKNKKYLVICGDYNIKFMIESQFKSELLSLMSAFNLKATIIMHNFCRYNPQKVQTVLSDDSFERSVNFLWTNSQSHYQQSIGQKFTLAKTRILTRWLTLSTGSS